MERRKIPVFQSKCHLSISTMDPEDLTPNQMFVSPPWCGLAELARLHDGLRGFTFVSGPTPGPFYPTHCHCGMCPSTSC